MAGLQGRGTIRHVHVTRHQNEQLTSRGAVLEIHDGKPDVIGKNWSKLNPIQIWYNEIKQED